MPWLLPCVCVVFRGSPLGPGWIEFSTNLQCLEQVGSSFVIRGPTLSKKAGTPFFVPELLSAVGKVGTPVFCLYF